MQDTIGAKWNTLIISPSITEMLRYTNSVADELQRLDRYGLTTMKDNDCVRFLQWVLPQLRMRWPGFRKVRRQVCKRIDRRLAELGLSDINTYRDWITGHPEEWHVLDACCQITISRFYRDRGVFDRLRDAILRQLADAAQATGRHEWRCWSAGCASGEEPYTVNILWKSAVSPLVPGMTCGITATDCNPLMLQRAQEGLYSTSSLKDLPRELLADCFVPVDGQYSVRPPYRRGIEWYVQDLRKEAPDGVFDLILCRHLPFTYFDRQLQIEVLDRVLSRLRPGGVLVTGKQESLPTVVTALMALEPKMGIYRLRHA